MAGKEQKGLLSLEANTKKEHGRAGHGWAKFLTFSPFLTPHYYEVCCSRSSFTEANVNTTQGRAGKGISRADHFFDKAHPLFKKEVSSTYAHPYLHPAPAW